MENMSLHLYPMVMDTSQLCPMVVISEPTTREIVLEMVSRVYFVSIIVWI